MITIVPKAEASPSADNVTDFTNSQLQSQGNGGIINQGGDNNELSNQGTIGKGINEKIDPGRKSQMGKSNETIDGYVERGKTEILSGSTGEVQRRVRINQGGDNNELYIQGTMGGSNENAIDTGRRSEIQQSRRTIDGYVERGKAEILSASKGEVQRRIRINHTKNSSVSFTEGKADNTEGYKAYVAFANAGMTVIYCDGPIERTVNGVTVSSTEAFTAPDGTVYISSESSLPAKQTFDHEKVHVAQKSNAPAYIEYESVLCDEIDYLSPAYKKVAREINKNQFDNKHDIEDIDTYPNFMREIAAYINQFVLSDPAFAEQTFGGMFENWGAVVEAVNKFNTDMKADFTESANFMPENKKTALESGKNVDVNSLIYENKKKVRRHTTAAEQSLIKRVANSLGVKLEFTHITADLLRSYGYDFKEGDVLPDGYFDNDTNTIHIGYTVYNPMAFIFKHELTHFGEGTEQYKNFVKAVKNSKTFKKWLRKETGETKFADYEEAYIQKIAKERGYTKGERDFLTEDQRNDLHCEMIADFVGKCIFTEDTTMLENMLSDLDYKERNAFAQFILDFLSYLKKKLAGNKEIVFEIFRLENNFNRMISETVKTQKENPTENGGDLQFSISETFKKHYDSWDKKNPRIRFEIGTTSTVLQSLGVPNRKIFWDSSKIIKIQSNHSEMVDSVIKQVPEILENPIVVMESKTKENRLTMFGEVYVDNKPILAILELNPTDRAGIELDELKIASAYLKENAQNLLDKSVILYVDKNKKRVSEWEKRTRLQLPVGDSLTNSNNSISNNQLSVNQNHKSNLQFSFASVQDEALIKKAEKMEMKLITEGKGDSITRLRIWKKFGILRDGGGKWVYEIDDSSMEFIPFKEKIIENPELLELYELEIKEHLSDEQNHRREALRNKYKYIILKAGNL